MLVREVAGWRSGAKAPWAGSRPPATALKAGGTRLVAETGVAACVATRVLIKAGSSRPVRLAWC